MFEVVDLIYFYEWSVFLAQCTSSPKNRFFSFLRTISLMGQTLTLAEAHSQMIFDLDSSSSFF